MKDELDVKIDSEKQRFGAYVQRQRNKKGYSQDELGDLIGITRKSVSCIERGECFPSPENIFKLASALDMSLDEFVFSFKKFDETISIDEINNMLATLDAEQQALVISVLRSMCKVLTKKK